MTHVVSRRWPERLLLLCAAFLFQANAGAFGLPAHRLICDIAWRELRPPAREEVKKLLEHDPAVTFAQACVWADTVRRVQTYKWLAPLHYMNVPRDAQSVDEVRDCPDGQCVLAAIRRFRDELADASLPEQRRVRALKLLGHFVGDIHQPLHVAYADDHGGLREVRFDGGYESLHYLWDGGFLGSLGRDWRPDGKRLQRAVSARDRRRWLKSGPEDWANESLGIVRAHVYKDLSGGDVTQAYAERARGILITRIQQAGVRLGALLNRILDP